MPRRALGKPITVPMHLLLQADDEGTSQERRLRRYARWRLSPHGLLTLPETYARWLARQGKTAGEIVEAVARLDVDTDTRLSRREERQVESMRELDPEKARWTVRRWLAKGRLRQGAPMPPPPHVSVWADRIQCSVCGREQASLRKILTRRDVRGRELDFGGGLWLLPSGEGGTGYCRTCKRRRLFHVIESRRIPKVKVEALITAWAQQPPLARSRFLLTWLRKSRRKPVVAKDRKKRARGGTHKSRPGRR